MDARGDTALGAPTLVVTSDDGTERTFALGEGALLIGRATGNDVVLSGAEKGASRRHAELRFDDGRYVVVDLESQNGTWVNGERVHRSVVVPGTEIVIGLYRLRLEYGRPPVTDIPLRRPAAPASARQATVEPRPPGPTWTMVVAAAVVAASAMGFAVWRTLHVTTPNPALGPAPAAAPAVPAAAPPSAEVPTDPAGSAAADATPPPSAPASPAGTPQAAAGAPSASRLAALSAFQAGVKLDAAGDWVGALKKFDDARQLDPTVPDLDRTQKQVAGKMRDAGYAALQRAIDLERQGKLTDAATEYDRAIQWLPADDRRRAIAADRAAQLKEGTK